MFRSTSELQEMVDIMLNLVFNTTTTTTDEGSDAETVKLQQQELQRQQELLAPYGGL